MIVTLRGNEVMVTITNGGVKINDATLVLADVTADNGVVHIIDAVLFPNPTDCDSSTAVDAGCGCGNPGPSGCDDQCGSTAVDAGCGCGNPVLLVAMINAVQLQ